MAVRVQRRLRPARSLQITEERRNRLHCGPAGSVSRNGSGPPFLAAAVPCPVRAAGDECGGAEPRPARCVVPGPCLPQPGRPVPLAALAWCLFTGQLSARSPAGGLGPAFAIWGGTTPRNPPLRCAPRRGTSPTHRPLTGPRPGSLCAARGDDPPEPPAVLRAPPWYLADTPATHRAKARFAVLARGDDPPEAPAALRAPPWYLADTPATHRAKARFAVLARGDDPPEPPAALRAPPCVPRRHTGHSPGQGPVRWASNERLAVTRGQVPAPGMGFIDVRAGGRDVTMGVCPRHILASQRACPRSPNQPLWPWTPRPRRSRRPADRSLASGPANWTSPPPATSSRQPSGPARSRGSTSTRPRPAFPSCGRPWPTRPPGTPASAPRRARC